MSVSTAEFAWPGGDRPGRLDFEHEPPRPVVEAITEALEPCLPAVADGRSRLLALVPVDGAVGRYRLVTPEASWFVRVSSRWGEPELERALTGYLERRRVPVNAPRLAGRPLPWNGRILRLDVRPAIAGRHFDGSPADLRALAAALAACHAALAEFDGRAAVRAAAAARYRRLAEIGARIGAAASRGDFTLFAERSAWAAAHRDWLVEMAERFAARFDELPGAQCLHGEVHPGNVLFRSGDDGAVLVDFEESVHVFAPPAWDLAFLVQRFCLGDDPAPGVARRRVSTAADAYAGPWPRLAPMMRQAAWFSVAVIVEARTAYGVITAADEYDKFVRLERQARAFEEAL
jgi:hypothetical protein